MVAMQRQSPPLNPIASGSSMLPSCMFVLLLLMLASIVLLGILGGDQDDGVSHAKEPSAVKSGPVQSD